MKEYVGMHFVYYHPTTLVCVLFEATIPTYFFNFRLFLYL